MSTNFSTSTTSTTYGSADTIRNGRRLLLLATLATLALWFLPYSDYLLYPLRLFITFIHESGHALAAIASGGDVKSLTVSPNGEGVTYAYIPDWAKWLLDSGGYLGTALFGAILLQVGRLGRGPNAGRVALYIIAGYVLLSTLLWAHNPFIKDGAFTLATGLVLTALIWAVARFTSPEAANFAASFLAVQCSLNALGDIRILLYLTSNHLGDNDAVFMARDYGLPPTFWAVMWAAMALVILFVALRGYCRPSKSKSAASLSS